MPQEISEELLGKYINNLCTEAEKQFVENWYDSYEIRPALFPDEESDEARQWNKKSETVVKLMITDLEKTKNILVKEVSLIQSWFLKSSEKILKEN